MTRQKGNVMNKYTIIVAREMFFTQVVEAESEDHLYIGDYKVVGEDYRSTAPDEVMSVERGN